MIIELIFEKRFEKDLRKVANKKVLQHLKRLILKVSEAKNLSEINEKVKRLKSNSKYYRIRIGDYRIGLEVQKGKVIFVRILLRKDIYK